MVESEALDVLKSHGWFPGSLSNDRVWSFGCVQESRVVSRIAIQW